MDPLSIAASCLALASGVAKASSVVVEFTRDARNASKDMVAILAELQALGDILTPFTTSLPTISAVPQTLLTRVETILSGCMAVVNEINKLVGKYVYQRNKVFAKIGWSMFGQADVQRLRESLTGYKTALNLGIQVISISIGQVVVGDTTAIREQNVALMENVDTILAQLRGIQSAKSSGHKHQRIGEWMDEIDALTSYAETAYAATAYADTAYAETVAEQPAAEPTDSAPLITYPVIFKPVYQEGDPGKGIGGYDLRSPLDRCYPLDFNSTGRLDHLVFFRPGTGLIVILQNKVGTWTPVFQTTSGIPTYDNILTPDDRAFAFDFSSTGCPDHLLFYRPGSGILAIIRNDVSTSGTYTPIFRTRTGLSGFDLSSPSDRIFPFDYTHSGHLDHLALYRPGAGLFLILRNDVSTTGTFTPVYHPTNGIAGFDLTNPRDRAFAFDWDSSGKTDHIALYRPGEGLFTVVKHNDDGVFSPAWSSAGQGVGGYDLARTWDVAFAYDWDHTGKRDHVAFYRPGTGTFWVVARDGKGWKAVFAEGDPGRGVGGYDLARESDRVFAFDYEGSGRADCLVAYRRNGTGTIWILRHV
ncbi:hypothetical protein B0T16DRAFT_455120 [Cercophora newfieldiana]|uniref:Azaphilone pigments biosynthesis cluster protein L N-terminal domain-containing protein n=1 Tax=Cercophora newfieldiana TaxID=92897 RepID=A0AA39YHK9_9PEZI|nr:hypothetical protein B0T16DRAFT_455120 [Cercophora newfieldiana]